MPPVGPVSTPVVIGRHQELATWMLCSTAAAASCSFRVKRALARAGSLGKLLPEPRFVAIAFSRALASITATSRSRPAPLLDPVRTYAIDYPDEARERLRTVAPRLLSLAPRPPEDPPPPLLTSIPSRSGNASSMKCGHS